MYWECCEQRAAELLPGIKFSEHLLTTDKGASLKMLAHHTRSISEDNASDLLPLHKMWSALIVRYSSYHLTFDSDKLVAISGVARGMCRQMKMEHNDSVAGLGNQP
jgi:hypothetical protein